MKQYQSLVPISLVETSLSYSGHHIDYDDDDDDDDDADDNNNNNNNR